MYICNINEERKGINCSTNNPHVRLNITKRIRAKKDKRKEKKIKRIFG